MIHVLSLVLTPLIFSFVLLLLAGIVFSLHRKASAWISVVAVVVLYAFSTPMATFVLSKWFSPYMEPVSIEQPYSSNRIILLGGGLNIMADGYRSTLSGSGDRLLLALDLYHLQSPAIIYLTGGNAMDFHGILSEAQGTQELFVRLGISEESFLLETKSTSTAENAAFLAELYPELLTGTSLLVTSASHMRRAQEEFCRHGVDTIAMPAVIPKLLVERSLWEGLLPTAGSLDVNTALFSEILGWYYLTFGVQKCNQSQAR